jgi:hypothetical protein
MKRNWPGKDYSSSGRPAFLDAFYSRAVERALAIATMPPLGSAGRQAVSEGGQLDKVLPIAYLGR